MPNYMLLLHDDPSSFTSMSPQQMQQVLQQYVAWGNALRQSGVLQDSHKLTDEPGRVLRSSGGTIRVTDGPYSETKEVLGGYYTLSAADYDKAVEIARGCPHLEYGGTIEVREIDTMGA